MEANNNNIQTSLTSWEKTVLDNAKMVAKDSDDGKSFIFEELCFTLDGSVNSIKGALGSLTAKGLIIPLEKCYYDFQIKF